MRSGGPDFDLRCEWGEAGLARLAPESDVVVVVDVLSFSSAVDVAVSRGACVHPCRSEDAAALARRLGADLAGARGDGLSLSPASLLGIPPDTHLVLPSPNGSTLCRLADARPVLTGCLRNASAVAGAAAALGRRIALVPAGERWEDGSLRPCFEDLVGAGAVLRHLPGARSPGARAAEAAFRDAAPELGGLLAACPSGRELTERGFADDVALAAELETSGVAPLLVDGAFEAAPEMDTAPELGQLRVRPYRESDEAGVVALWAVAFPDAPAHNAPLADIARKLSVQRDLFLVGECEGRVVATAMAGFDGHRGWVHYVATDPRARGRGLASALLAEVEARLRALGCSKLNLQVRGTNRDVVAFYERLGFVVEDRVSLGKRLQGGSDDVTP
jgi:2-phosphosulfolactate phosphatase